MATTMHVHLAIIADLRKTITELNKTILNNNAKINKLMDERFIYLKSEPRESQKAYIECGQTQQFIIHRELSKSIEKINENNAILKKYKLKVRTIQFVHEDIFDRVDCQIRLIAEDRERVSDDSFLYIKDKYYISDLIWTVLKVVLSLDMPSAYSLSERRKQLNSIFPITETEQGFYCEPIFRINQELRNLFQINPEIFIDPKIIIKLQLDGFVVHRLSNLLNFSFSIVNEGKKSTTASGTYLIGLFHIKKECYEELKLIVTDVWNIIKTITTFEHEGSHYPIEFKSCSDHKMQALVNILILKL
jgi:hypothetical protein